MANEEHLARLKQGVEAWNQWRDKYPKIRPDLSGADLTEIQLYAANLSRANLTWARLAWAKLAAADLTGTNLTWANLFGVNLAEASLRRADLLRANLTWADLIKVDLHEATIGWTILGNVDLSTARGLETVQHEGPSIIGIDTLYRSHGIIPEVLLRGAGVPDEMITYSKSLVGQPFQYYSCFISYSNRDEALAQRLHADLQDKGVRCWFAPEDLKIGDEFRSRIDESIQVYDRLLLILSEYSVQSRWVQKELDSGVFLLPHVG